MRNAMWLHIARARCVLEFCRRFTGLPLAAVEGLVTMKDLVARAGVLLEARLQAQQEASAAMTERDGIADPFIERLRHLVRLARATATQVRDPELRVYLHLSRSRQGSLPIAARAAIATATAHEAVLLRYGMPPDMLAHLTEDLARYEAAQERRINALAASAAATQELQAIARVVTMIIQHLDALYRIHFARRQELLAEWDTARAIRWHQVSPAPETAPGSPVFA